MSYAQQYLRRRAAFGLGSATAPTAAEVAQGRADATLANATGIPVPALRAIRSIESGGNPSAIRFETRVFHNRTGRTVDGHDRAAFQSAYAINPTEAVNSTSWGWYQVMGFNGVLRAYGSPSTLVAAFDAHPEDVSARAFQVFMDAPSHLPAKIAARSANFRAFAHAYNGCCRDDAPGCTGCDHYAGRMQSAYDRAVGEWRVLAPLVGISTPEPWPTWAPWAIAGGAGAVVVGSVGAAVWAVKRRRT